MPEIEGGFFRIKDGKIGMVLASYEDMPFDYIEKNKEIQEKVAEIIIKRLEKVM